MDRGTPLPVVAMSDQGLRLIGTTGLDGILVIVASAGRGNGLLTATARVLPARLALLCPRSACEVIYTSRLLSSEVLLVQQPAGGTAWALALEPWA